MDGVVTLNALDWRSASKKRPRKRVMSARRLSILLLTSLSVCKQCRHISDGAREDRTGPVDGAKHAASTAGAFLLLPQPAGARCG
jgi:hypothetical protein